jgi:sulfite exporter TauE/SafE
VNVAGRLAGVQQAVAVGAGGLMILLGLGAAGVNEALRRLEARASGRVMALVRGALSGGGPGRLYPTGLALGLLPCGFSWTAFLGAAGTGSALEGFLLALAFGLGTAPALLLVGVAGTAIGARARSVFTRLGGVLVALLGVVLVLRGIGVVLPGIGLP